MGACCIDGECSVISASACADAGGNYLGDGSTCEGVDCTQGACCNPDGSCAVTTEGECTGVYQGDGTVCDPNPCPPVPCILCADATGVDPIYVTVTGVSLCGCIDNGDGSSFSVIDGHFVGGTPPGINSVWAVPFSSGTLWDGFTINGGSDPYFYTQDHGNSGCSDLVGTDLSACPITVTCADDIWTVHIAHLSYGLAFSGTGCGTETDPILNDFTGCSEDPRQIGFGGQVTISLTAP